MAMAHLASLVYDGVCVYCVVDHVSNIELMNWQGAVVALVFAWAVWQLYRILFPAKGSRKNCGSSGAACGCEEPEKPRRLLGFRIDH